VSTVCGSSLCKAGAAGSFNRSASPGVLVALVKGTLAKTQAGFDQMNAALKTRVEQTPA